MTENVYLTRYAWKSTLFSDYQPKDDLSLILVIPSYKEQNLFHALDAINQCTAPPKGFRVLIMVLINESEGDDEEAKRINTQCLEDLQHYTSTYELLFIRQSLPQKKAGVGLARKIGMDEAVRIFERINKDGIIACYDADCGCEPNYLTSIYEAFNEKQVNAGIVFYEHILNGINQEAIIKYELYLRYYIGALRYAGFPFAHQTLGSCIIVRSSTYQKQGGMNTRKAGEDFYFLNKVVPLGNFIEINSTSVFPSDRISDRVPFGTGKSVERIVSSNVDYEVYHPDAFEELMLFFKEVQSFNEGDDLIIPDGVKQFLGANWKNEILEIKDKTASPSAFIKRFYQWFDAFKILKYVHYYRDVIKPNIPLETALEWLEKKRSISSKNSPEEKLIAFRAFDRKDQIRPL